MSSNDPRIAARDRLIGALLRPLESAGETATEYVQWLLAEGWRPPLAPVRDWQDTRRLAAERVAWHAAQARAGITRSVTQTEEE